MTSQGGIGMDDVIPWHDSEELSIFKNKTMGHVVIMGSKTYRTIPTLYNRFISVISSEPHSVPTFTNIEDSITYNMNQYRNSKIFIIGGGMLFAHVLEKYSHIINKIHISILDHVYECNHFVNIDFSHYNITQTQKFKTFTHLELVPKHRGETQYLSLLKDVLETGVCTLGRNGNVKNLFNRHLQFDLTKGFPLLTTKKMFLRGIVEELLFFLRGDTDSKLLEAKNINIWKGNTSSDFIKKSGLNYPEGLMGPMYGYQWRNFGAIYDNSTGKALSKGVDQLTKIIESIKTDPASRRHILTDFNPSQADEGVLYPCHSIIIQFFVNDGFLDMFCYNRSSDLLLGLPFNIASSSLLLVVIGKLVGLIPRFFNLTLGDCHIYEQHIDAVLKQLERIPRKFPSIDIDNFDKVEDLTFAHFKLNNYSSYDAIKADMVC